MKVAGRLPPLHGTSSKRLQCNVKEYDGCCSEREGGASDQMIGGYAGMEDKGWSTARPPQITARLRRLNDGPSG